MRDDYATACEAARTGEKGAGKPPSVRLVVAGADPSDPPETWLDRMAGRALEGMLAYPGEFVGLDGKTTTRETVVNQAEYAVMAYNVAAAMLAEKRRREKKEVEE